MTLPREVREARELVVLELRNECGLTPRDIAREMGISPSVVSEIISDLVCAGKTKALPRGRPSTAFWRNLADPKTQDIIEMVKRRATHQELAEFLGCQSREYPRKLIERMEDLHGAGIWENSEANLVQYSFLQAAEILKVSRSLIVRICHADNICLQRRGKREFLLSEAAMECLRNHPRITRKSKCIVCKKDFVCTTRGGAKAIVCRSRKCKRKRQNQLRKRLLSGRPNGNLLRGWRLELWQKLRSWKLPKHEQWIGLSKAAKMAGLTVAKIWYLGCNGVIAKREHPTHVHFRSKKPVVLYAASQMEIVRQVYQAHQQKNGAL